MAAPRATLARMRLSSTPNTRASTSSGTARCRRVSPATSTTVLRGADEAEQDERGGRLRPRRRSARSARPRRRPRARTRLRGAACRPGRREDRPGEAADPERRVEVAEPRIAQVEEFERDHDEQDAERPPDERLRREESDEETKPALAERWRGSPEHRGCDRLVLSALASSAASERSGSGASADQRNVQAVTAKATPVLVAARTAPPIAGPAKAATLSTVLEVTFAAVNSSGVRASEGTSGRLGGPEGGRHEGDERHEPVDDAGGRFDEGGGGRAGERAGAQQVGREHDPLPREAVGQNGGEGRADRRRQEANEPDEPDRGRPALLEGEDRDSDDADQSPSSEPAQASSSRRRSAFAKTPRKRRPVSASRPEAGPRAEDGIVSACAITSARKVWEDAGRPARLVGKRANRRADERRAYVGAGARERKREPDEPEVEGHLKRAQRRGPGRGRRRHAPRRRRPGRRRPPQALTTAERGRRQRRPAHLLSSTSASAASRRRPAGRASSSRRSIVAASFATAASSSGPPANERLRAAPLLEEVERDRRLAREETEQVHVGERELRLAVEHLEDAERPLLLEERDRHEPLRHVAGSRRELAGEARILRDVLEHERLARDEHPARDPGARRESAGRGGASSPSPEIASKTSSSVASSKRKIEDARASKIARAVSTIERRSATCPSSEPIRPVASAALKSPSFMPPPRSSPSGRGRS